MIIELQKKAKMFEEKVKIINNCKIRGKKLPLRSVSLLYHEIISSDIIILSKHTDRSFMVPLLFFRYICVYLYASEFLRS